MNFGAALEMLKAGRAVARQGWQPDTWLILVPGSEFPVAPDRPLGRAIPSLVGEPVRYRPHIDKLRGDRGTMEPWAPTCEALLADDWLVR